MEEQALNGLLARALTVTREGFALDFSAEPEAWDRYLKARDRDAAYQALAEALCGRYEARFGEPFLFTEACVAWEVRYHAEAYFHALGYPGYRPHLSTWLFDRDSLIRHTRSVEIDVGDAHDPRQALMFGYRSGVRDCWRGTDRDPFRR